MRIFRSDNIFGLKGRSIIFIMILGLLASVSFSGLSQDNNKKRRPPKSFSQAVAYNPDSVEVPDSIKALRDSLRIVDSLFRIDSIALQKQSSLEHPAFTGAKDSLREDFSNGQRKAYYYGDVTVTYGDMKLTADYMEYDMKTGTVFARGTLDTLTGEIKGMPTMSQGNSSYTMKELKYNFNSRKAKITEMITQQDEGLLHGKNIKMMPDKSINITEGKYTVCDLEHPH